MSSSDHNYGNRPVTLIVSRSGRQGAQGEKGERGADGLNGGGNATGDKHYRHDQSSAASVWTIAHGLGKAPSITVLDSAGDIAEGHIAYPDLNTAVLTFSAAFSGTAYLN